MARKPTSACEICGEKYKPHDNNNNRKSYCLVCATSLDKFYSLARELGQLQPKDDVRRSQIIHRMGELNIVLRSVTKTNRA